MATDHPDPDTLGRPPELSCRSCGRQGLRPIMSLGHTPLANALLNADQLSAEEPTLPLDLFYCPHCTLAQISEAPSPESLFREYVYFSSYSDTLLDHARQLAEQLIAERGLGPQSLVVEIASNDGYLLGQYRARGIPVLGVEPARNIARVAVERGIATIDEFFGRELAARLVQEGRRADVLHAHNVLAHVPDLNGFAAGMETLLAHNGLVVVEVPYLIDLVDGGEFDTIYHEHLCYFSLTALDRLFARHGLSILEVERLPIHGGSLRLRIQRAQAGRQRASVDQMLREEQQWGVEGPDRYQQFAERVQAILQSLRELLGRLKQEGKRIAIYGASAKGNTLLSCLAMPPETFEFVVDRSPAKQGRYMPGNHLPIHEPQQLLDSQPDYALLLTWNFQEEILGQQAEYRRRGGRFILPLPEVRVV